MRRHAFTLIELLVVISIIALLLGILFPALMGARRAGLTMSCLSNIRQLQIASLMYSMDHKDRLIEPGLSHGGAADEEIAWINNLSSYYGESTVVVRSPVDRSPHWPLEAGGDGVPIQGTTNRFRRTSYGINNYVTSFLPVEVQPGDTPDMIASKFFNRLYKIDRPTETIQFLLMTEEGEFAGADHVHVESWWSRHIPDASPALASRNMAIGAHGGEKDQWSAISSYGFLDGHAKTMRFEDVYRNPEQNLFDPRLP